MLAVSRTSRGLVRPNNEDSVLVQVPHLFAIADGMGGYNGGEIASREAVKRLAALDFSKVKPNALADFLQQQITQINKEIWQLWQEQPEYKGMGTTLSVFYISSASRAVIGHVGDSRIYLWQDGKLRQLTSDHSVVAEMLRQKKITPHEADCSKQKHMIMRAIGADATVQVDTMELLLNGVQRILLCSDGLTNMVTEQQLQQAMQEPDLDKAADYLLEKALQAGGRDNISLILLALEDTPL